MLGPLILQRSASKSCLPPAAFCFGLVLCKTATASLGVAATCFRKSLTLWNRWPIVGIAAPLQQRACCTLGSRQRPDWPAQAHPDCACGSPAGWTPEPHPDRHAAMPAGVLVHTLFCPIPDPATLRPIVRFPFLRPARGLS
jgi:hypothetical protein